MFDHAFFVDIDVSLPTTRIDIIREPERMSDVGGAAVTTQDTWSTDPAGSIGFYMPSNSCAFTVLNVDDDVHYRYGKRRLPLIARVLYTQSTRQD